LIHQVTNPPTHQVQSGANFTMNVGAQIGFRSMDLGYEIKSDTASLTLQGIYFGIVARY
jgi:hypothetical protein